MLVGEVVGAGVIEVSGGTESFRRSFAAACAALRPLLVNGRLAGPIS